MGQKKEKNTEERCSLFEEMLMWTSYRYCIGRKSYVSSMCDDIASHYYNRLSDERLEFTSMDIRREIMEHLRFLPFSFEIHRYTNDDEFNPIAALMEFIKQEDITKLEELSNYARVTYEPRENVYKFEKKTPTIASFFDAYDLECLIGWDRLASCFDKKNHKLVKIKHEGKEYQAECFPAWKRTVVPIPEKEGYFQTLNFGWEQVWIPVDEYVKGRHGVYAAPDEITSIDNIAEEK